MSSLEPIIKLENIGVRFGSLVVHRDINFTISPGEVVTIMGPSGTGKTLLLKIIVGLLRPTHGRAWVFGRELCGMSEELLRDTRKDVGMLFQGAALFDSMTVFENVAYSLREFGQHSEAQIAQIVEERLEVVGLAHVIQKYPPQLSGGQKKRVGLARALASSPKVVLFDEPTTGLDPTSIKRIDDLVLTLKKKFGITCVLVTHDVESARRVSDRWILVNQGLVVANGSAQELSRTNEDVIRFIRGEWEDDA